MTKNSHKLTREQKLARQRAYDLKRYEAAMKAKREHVAKYGPDRLRGELRLETAVMCAGASGKQSQ